MIPLLLALLTVTPAPVYLQDPKHPTQNIFSRLADAGYGLSVTCDNCSSAGGPSSGLTNTELRLTPVPVSGTLTCSGPLTDTQVRATPLPVSGTLTCSGPLTDTQLRTTPVPVSGTLTCSGPLTDTQLRATPVPVSGSLTCAVSGATLASGSRIAADTYNVNDGGYQNVYAFVGFDGGLVTAAIIGRVTVDTYSLNDGGYKNVYAFVSFDGGLVTAAIIGRVTTDNYVHNDGGYQNVYAYVAFDAGAMNVALIGGVAPLMGAGATGTGSPRVTIANDSTGYGTANGAIPAQSQLESSRAVAYGSSPAAVGAGNNAPRIADLEGRQYVNPGHPRAISCVLTTTATTSTQITGCEVVASNSIYITFAQLCGDIANATATPAILQSGTSTACSGPHIIASGYHPATNCVTWNIGMPGIKVTVAEGLCILDGVTGTKKALVVGYVAP